MDDSVFITNDKGNGGSSTCSSNYLNNCLLLDNIITMSSPKLTNKESDNNLRRASETSSFGSPTKFRAPYCIGSGAVEMLIEPVEEEITNDDRPSKWEYRNVSLNRVSGYGFGIAVSGGRDNPHFKNGDPSIVVSDVLKGGPAAESLHINDRIVSANGHSLENADYATAVQIMKDTEQLNLIVKRRVPLPVVELEQKTLKFTLTKTKKKDDFGIVLGCRFYVKQITNKRLADKEPGLKEGDSVLRINDVDCDQLTMADARKLLDKSRERLSLVIRRDVPKGTHWKWSSQATLYERLGNDTPIHSPTPRQSPLVSCRINGGILNDFESLYGSSNYARYNRPANNSQSSSRSRTPVQHALDPAEIIYAGLSSRVAGPLISSQKSTASGDDASRSSSSGVHVNTNNESASSNKPPLPSPLSEARCISFSKEGGSVGIRVIGGNDVGIFVSAVQAGSPAACKGVRAGDKILRVNDRDMRHVTREEAVLQLLSAPDQVDFVLQYRREEYDKIRAQNLGDNFFIRTHFDYDKPSDKNELTFKKGDILQVVDTLFGGTVGSWQAVKISAGDKIYEEPPLKGIIPNSSKAEQLSASEKAKEVKENGSGHPSASSLIKRKMTLVRRTKSNSKGHSDEVALSQVLFPAYERVRLRNPGFLRPIVIFGPLADIATEKLLQDFPLRFATPNVSATDQVATKSGSPSIIRLSCIKEIMNKNKHCLLDVTPASIEKLQYAQFCPIVVYINVESRNKLRELRRKSAPKADLVAKSTKKLMDDSNKIYKHFRHLATAVLDASQRSDWFDALRELISHLQERRVWMAETLPADVLDDDFLFSMSSTDNSNNRPSSRQKSGSHQGDSEADSLKEENSDYGTLSARKVQNKPNGPQRCSDSQADDEMFKGDANNDVIESFASVRSNKEESPSSQFQEGSNDSTGSAACSNAQSDSSKAADASNSNSTVESAMSYCSSANNTVRRVSCASSGSTNGPGVEPVLSTKNSHVPFSPTNGAFPFVADHVTRFEINRPNVNQHLIDPPTANLPYVTDPPSAYRGSRHLSEPGFYDVRQILDVHSNDYGPPQFNGAQMQQSSRAPDYNNHCLPNFRETDHTFYYQQPGSKFVGHSTTRSPHNGQYRQLRLPSYEDYGRTVAPEIASRSQIRNQAISRTPSNPVPLPTHYANYSAFGRCAQSRPETSGDAYAEAQCAAGLSNAAVAYDSSAIRPPVRATVARAPPPPAPRSPHFTAAAGRLSLPSENATCSGPNNVASARGPLENLPPSEHLNSPLKLDAKLKRPTASGPRDATVTRDAYPYDDATNGAPPPASNTLKRTPFRTSDRTPVKMTSANATIDYSSSGVQVFRHNSANASSAMKRCLVNGDDKSNDQYQNNFSDVFAQRSAKASVSASRAMDIDKNAAHQAPNDPISNESRTVLAHVAAKIGAEGGTLVSESTQVVLKIPPGALNSEQNVFFEVFRDSNLQPSLDKDKGEKMLTPLLMLGPQGLTFSKPVELLLPHSLSGTLDSNQWSFALKTTATNKNLDSDADRSPQSSVDQSKPSGVEWRQIPLLADAANVATPFFSAGGRYATNIDEKYASILLDKF